MNGSRESTRRRPHVSAASSASPENDGGFRESISQNGGGRRKSRESKLPRQYARRKGKSLSRMKLMCSKLGQLRILDVALFVGVTAKLVSIMYSWRKPSSSIHVQMTESPTLEPELAAQEDESSSTNWLPPRWLKRWVDHKMPFHSPLLYRREDDDYSFGHDSYLDDDQVVQGNQQKKRVRFKGMFQADYYFKDYQEQLNGHGYAVVDDVLYNAEEYRQHTQLALDLSYIQVNPISVEVDFDDAYSAFEFSDEEDEHKNYITDDEAYDAYFAFDDDEVRGTLGVGLMDKEESEGKVGDDSTSEIQDVCIRPSFYRTYHPTCNELHASLSGSQWLLGEEIYSRRWKERKHSPSEKSYLSKYLGHGYYRDAFLFQREFASYDDKDEPSTNWDEVVFKTMRHMYSSETGESNDDEIQERGMGFDPEDKYTFLHYQEDMRKDAMVMELLSSSPRALNIYSHCSMSSVMEFAPTDMEEYILPTSGYKPKMFVRRGAQNKNELDQPLNDFISAEEKLEIALEMAKCLAELHGYKEGVIVHVDVQVGQFFRGRDGLIKFVDYNRAEPLLYDAKNDKYCKFSNGVPADGTYRAPEENNDTPLTEKLDVYSLGNVFYALLTGEVVWAEYDWDTKMKRIVEGINLPIPEIYSESPSSETLVRAIRSCWTLDAEARPSIFKVVEFLEREITAQSNKNNHPPELKRTPG